ncbi:uncharacterized protein LOC131316831 [Rhododendron vialii]|uniref:uncharacterized protein LOC131316831 n=1 Tax=Rhododendron vialii TaxID=182163 RepID=UPI00265E7C76|nr:uncharacterized protein LOC131316831 [Rhododendron vialii]
MTLISSHPLKEYLECLKQTSVTVPTPSTQVLSPACTCVVYHRVEEEWEKTDESDTTSVSESAITNVMASDERVEDSAPDEDFAVDPCEAEDLEVEETGEGTMDD